MANGQNLRCFKVYCGGAVGTDGSLHFNCLNNDPHSEDRLRMGVGSYFYGTPAIRGIYQSLEANSGRAFRLG
jgi:hypothetical protein